MPKISPQLLFIALIIAMSSGLVACGGSSVEKDNHTTYGRTIAGYLGYYYNDGYVLPLNGSGMQVGCPLPTNVTYETEPLIDTSFNCHP